MNATVNVVVPMLSEDGWLSDPLIKADRIFGHFFASDYSQSELYAGHVASMAWVVQQAQGDVQKTITLLRNTLSGYLNNYFTNPVVTVSEYTGAGTALDSTRVALSIYASVSIAGKDVPLTKWLEINNGVSFKIININNG